MNLFDRLSGLAYKALNNKTAAPAKTAGDGAQRISPELLVEVPQVAGLG